MSMIETTKDAHEHFYVYHIDDDYIELTIRHQSQLSDKS